VIFLKLLGSWCVIGVVFLMVSFLFLVTTLPLCLATDFDEADEAVRKAERDLGLAFVAVADAEEAGADVNELIFKLNEAGVLLSEAYYAFDAEDYEHAVSSARSASGVVTGVINDAATLKGFAEKSGNDVLIYSALGSGVGVVILLIFARFGWRYLNRRFSRRVSDMKPEGSMA
jgi:hypothetical protein